MASHGSRKETSMSSDGLHKSKLPSWGAHRRYVFTGDNEGNESQVSPTIIEPDIKNEDETLIKEFVDELKSNKRNRVSRNQPGEVKAAHVKQSEGCHSSNKKKNTIEKWPAYRYKKAEENMFNVMKDLGATLTNPVSRPVLRKEARRHIGDTGLLDHLLKQMDGKVMEDGTMRFKRCFNTRGEMEYWLESADQEPLLIPPNRLIPVGNAVDSSLSAGELLELKDDITTLKREMQQLLNRKQEEENELVMWRVKTEGQINEIASSVRNAQSMISEELMTWKTKVEQQLAETKSSLMNLEPLKQYNTFCPPAYKWDEWLGNINLRNFNGDEDLLSFDGLDPKDFDGGPVVKDGSSLCLGHGNNPTHCLDNGKEQNQIEHPRNVAEEQPPVTTDSSAIDNSKSEWSTSLSMLKELFEWKPKIERQLLEIFNLLRHMQARCRKGK